ncbi:MAG: TonB family protein [Acidobacteriota bacterium]|nr:TonB family protein [Acidobacteriota bacterium]
MSPRYRIIASFGPRSRPLPRFVIGSLLFHVGTVAVLLALPNFKDRGPLPEPIVVSLVAPAVTKRVEGKPAAKKPTPQVKTEPKKETPKVEQPKVKKPKTAPKDVVHTKKAPTTPAPEPEVDDEPEIDESELAMEAGSGVAPLAGLSDEFPWYASAVQAVLIENWRRPLLTDLREPVGVRLEWQIQRDGRVTGLRILDSSGIEVLDRSALRAVQSAAPLPPLPPRWRSESLPVTYLFVLHPDDL